VYASRVRDASDYEIDGAVRAAAFQFLTEQTRIHGSDLPYALLSQGFTFRGQRVPLLGPQGIFKPAVLPAIPLSIATAPPKPGKAAPYADRFVSEHVLEYKYRGSDPSHRDNVGLREALIRHVPLIYLHGLVVGRYLAEWPVYVVGDDRERLTFRVELDARHLERSEYSFGADRGVERGYSEVTVLRRLHQKTFQARVLEAYREQCALCRLRHRELLDAAHIVPDSEEAGEPVVSNGLALCKLHHAAFDREIIGIRPDLIVEVRGDVLEEVDGPMLRHGLQGFHGQRIHVPGRALEKPDPERLRERYERFRRAS